MSDCREMADAADTITARAVLLIMLRGFRTAGAEQIAHLPLELQLKLSQHFTAMQKMLEETL